MTFPISDVSMNLISEKRNNQGMFVDVVSLTDKGPYREENEDSIAVVRASGYVSLAKGTLLLVADGMGGLKNGSVASSMVTSQLPALYFESRLFNPTESLVQSIEEINRRMYAVNGDVNSTQGMGSTVAACAIVNGSVVTVNVGDSRVYLFHDGRLRQLSRDHSLRRRHLPPFGNTRDENFSHMLAQALGPQPKVTPHVNITRIKENDILLLCSDGLTSVVTDAEIKDVLGNSGDAARELVSLVYKQLGDDNVSIIVGRVRASSGILE